MLAASTPLPAEEKAVDTNPPESRERPFIEITPREQAPTVRAIAPIDGANVFFLNHLGQVGVAKFSPGLSQIGWEFYSEVKRPTLGALALGPNYSVLTASSGELTQAFDTDRDIELDFFQALVRDWPGRPEGIVITAGPVADPHGRVLFALSPHSLHAGDPPKARILAWIPALAKSVPVTESELRIDAFAVNRSGLLAASLFMPGYEDGFFLSLTELPAPAADKPDAEPVPMPFTLPSLILPAELTGKGGPDSLAFVREAGREALLLPCSEARRLVEVVPEKPGALWQGAILLRAVLEKPIETLVEMAPGKVLGGGKEGFVPLATDPAIYRLHRIALAEEGIVLEFTQPVDRFEAVKADSFSVKAIALNGGESVLPVTPVIESDGRTVVLRTDAITPGNVLRVVCQNLPSETGAKLLDNAAFYTLHQR